MRIRQAKLHARLGFVARYWARREHSGSASSAGLTAPGLIIEALERFPQRDASVLGDQRAGYAKRLRRPAGSYGC